MAAPETENYLSVYREFLKEFTSTVYPNDPLPVKVTGYILDDADLEGEIIDWTRQYLNQRSCPPALATSIARSVLGELQNVIKDYHELRSQDEEEKDPLVPLRKRVSLERASLNTKGPHYDPLRLMHAVIANVRAVCERYLSDLEGGGAGAGVLSIPPPLPGPPHVSTFAIKNHRRKMEDRHVAIEDLNALFGITTSPCLVGYYAIFDGHHGHEAAAYSAAQLHCLLVHSKHYPQDPEAALKDSFFRADEIFIKKCASSKFLSGTTALVALVRHRESLHVAWLGDSLGILVRKGGQVTQFVNPHTAERQDERDRILSTGGAVFQHFGVWRINGTLAISRAIGDPECKPHVSALADVVSYPLDGSEHFMILACDGLWDCVTEAQAAAFVYDHLRKEPENHADLSKLLVNLAKSRASNDNISVVVVLLSPVEEILASAPPPATLALEGAQEEDYNAAEASPADGLAPVGAPLCQLLVNGAMDVEAATAAVDPSSNPFPPLFKGSPVPGPDAAPSSASPDGIPTSEDLNHHHQHQLDGDNHAAHDADDDGLAVDYNHSPYNHNHHNGHAANDIMTSSFYGNDGPNGVDARHLFGDPSDLGPETDVDLLDEDGMMDVGQAAEEEYKARAHEFGVEDGLGVGDMDQHLQRILQQQQHPEYPKEGDLLGAGDFSPSADHVDSSPILHKGPEEEQEREEEEEKVGRRVEMAFEDRPIPLNPFAMESDDWASGKTAEIEEEVERTDRTQFEDEPSTRQHYSDVDHQDNLMAEEVEVIPCKEEPTVEKEEVVVVHEEEVIEVGGGSGVEEADDDSEEEGEWKYVSAKPGEGGAVVPEAISPEATLPDNTSCSPALPEQELVVPDLSPALPPRVEVVTPEATETEDLHLETETGDLKPEEAVADDDKFCQDLGFEVVQKTHVEEVVYEPVPLEKPVEGDREPQVVPGEGEILEAKSIQHIEEKTDDSMMESRLNPDAAEFVPVSPTQNIGTETFSGFGNDFDTFRKEAEACPGEVTVEPVVASTPKRFAGLDEDSDTVLSSSFSCDAPRPSDTLQDELTHNVMDTLTTGNDFHDDDENKENISQECENKENMSQHVTISDVGSALNRSFEVLEEHASGNEKVSDFFGSPLNLSRDENRDEHEMAYQPMDESSTADLVPELSEPEKKLTQEELMHSPELVFESSPMQNVSEAPAEPAYTPKEVIANQCEELTNVFTVEGLSQHVPVDVLTVDDERISAKDDDMQQIKDSIIMESSPKFDSIPAVEAEEKIETFVCEEAASQNIEDNYNAMAYSPILQVCPMKVEDMEREHIQPELSSVVDVVQEDILITQEHTSDLIEVTPGITIAEENFPAEPSVETIHLPEAENTETITESAMKNDEVEPVEAPNVEPPLETVCVNPIFPTTTTEMSSIIEGSQALSLQEVPTVDEHLQKMEEVISESLNVASEMEIVQEITTQSLESHINIPASEIITSPEPVEIVDVTKEPSTSEIISPSNGTCIEPLVEDHLKEVVEEIIPDDVGKAAAVGGAGAAAAVAAVAGLVAAAASASSDTKPTAKKPIAGDKKQVPEKTRVSSTATTAAKAKSSKPPVTAARTTAPKKPAAPATTKTAPTPAARLMATERKPAASTAKPAATSRPSTTTTSLSSKPRTTATKPTTAPATRLSSAPKTSAPSRPSSGSTTAKSGVTTSSSKPVASSRPSTAPAKTTEPKKMLNGDATKPASASTAPSKTSPRKPATLTSTTTSKTLGTTRPVSATKGPAAPGKTSTETTATKAKQSPVSSAVNGAVPKTRTSLSTGAKTSAPAASRTKPAASAKTTAATSAPGIAKKAKESVNKHISATRSSGVTPTAQKSVGSPATKTSSPKSPASASMKTMTNGTHGKKAEVNSKKVEEKVELLISPHENGIALDCNEMRKELDGVVGMEDGVHEAKEQMVLIGDALSIGEAV